MSAAPVDVRPAPPRRRWVWRLLALVGVLLLITLCAGWWLLKTTSGASFALNYAIKLAGDGVKYEGVEGAIGGPLRIKKVEVTRPEMYVRVDDFVMDASPLQPLRGLLHVFQLSAGSIEVRTVDTGAAAKLPVSFAPPYAIRLDEGRVGTLRLGVLTPEAAAEKDPARKRALMDRSRDTDLVLKDIYLQGEGDQREWRLAQLRGETAYGKASLAGRVESTSPFAIDVKAALEGVAAERNYKATVAAKGTLKAIDAALDGEVSGQRATGRVLVEPFATQPVKSLELRAQGVDLARQAAGPRTRLDIEVKLAGEGKAFAGPVRIVNAEPGPWDQDRLPFNSASARVLATAEHVDIADLRLVLPGGGSATGKATLRKSGVVADLMLADVDLSALHRDLQKTRVRGRLGISGDKAAQRFEVALADPRFAINGKALLANQRLDVETATVRTGGGSVTAKGGMSLEGRKELRFTGRAEHFDPAAFVKASKGDLNFSFVAAGALAPAPSGEVTIEIAPSSYAGMPASGSIAIVGDSQRIAKADVSLALAEARLTARGAFGRAGDALDVTLRAPNLSVLAKPFNVALAGKADVDAQLTGTFKAPAGRVTLRAANLALPSDVFIRDLTLRAEAGSQPDSPIDAALSATAVALGKEKPPAPFAERIDASLKGTRAAHRFETQAQMTRESSLKLALVGGLDEKGRELTWNGRVEALSLVGRGAFTLTQPAALQAAANRVELGEAVLKGDWGEARSQLARWTPRSLELKGTSPGIEIQSLARSLRLGTLPRSDLVIAGDWDIRGLETFNGSLNVRRVSGDLRVGEPPLPLGLQTLELQAQAVGGRATATFNLTGERIGKMRGDGSGSIVRGAGGWEFASTSPVQAHLVAEHANLEALSPWLGVDAKLGGRLQADINVSGTGADPRIAGRAQAVDLLVREPQSGFEIENGQVALRMDGKTLAIEKLTATTPWKPAPSAREHFGGLATPPSGSITAEGAVDMGARTGSLRVKAEHAVLTQSPTRFLAVSGEANLEAGDKGLVASGAFKADAGWIGALESAPPSISEDVVVVRAAKPVSDEPHKGGEPIRIEARFALGDHLYFEGRGIDTRLAGDIQVSGPPTALRAVGTIQTIGGTYNGYGQKLSIERGLLRFAGPVDNPQLSVLALRKGLGVEAGVEVLGTVARPRVRLVSSPDVPEPEKLSWLVLGRGPSDLAPGDASVLLAAATSMLGKNNPGSDLGKKLGLDEVRIGRADTNSILGVLPQSTVAGKTGSASASEVVSVSKKLTRDLHLTYEQGLADAEGALKLSWQITRQFQLLARAGFLPGLDAVYRWSFK